MGRQGVVKDDRKTIYVKNLPFRATEEELDSFFSQAGKVVDVRRGTTAEGENREECPMVKYSQRVHRAYGRKQNSCEGLDSKFSFTL